MFCPIPSGAYDVVIVAENTAGLVYDPSIVTGVANGQTTGTVNLFQNIANIPSSAPAIFTGSVTSQNGSSQGTIADVQVSALEMDLASSTTFTIPLAPNTQQTSATLALETAASSGCASGTDCTSYKVSLPVGGPRIGAYSTSGATLTQTNPLASYVFDGVAFVPSSGGTADCSPFEQKTQANTLTPTGSFNVSVQALAFAQCQ